MATPRAIRPIAVLAALTLLFTGCSSNDGPKPYVAEATVSTLNATVEAIDPETRQITLTDKTGQSVSFEVDRRVRNLERVKVGDEVRAAYVEAVEIEVRDAGKNAQAAADAGDWEEAPDGTFSRAASITAVVDRIEKKKSTVWLRGPRGKVVPFRVRDPRNLENVKIGDQVVATHSEGLAIGIDPIER